MFFQKNSVNSTTNESVEEPTLKAFQETNRETNKLKFLMGRHIGECEKAHNRAQTKAKSK